MKNKFFLVVLFELVLATCIYGQSIDTAIVDSTQKEVPEAILELVRQYDKAVKEARSKQQIVEPPTLEIDGIIMDETMSKSGREFYEIFFANWSKPTGYSNYYLKIKEKPFQFNNTIIEVYLKEQLIYQQMMKRRYDEVEQMAKGAVVVAQQQIYREIKVQREILEQQRRYQEQERKSN
ncbi:hypothetical protein KDU71_08910 [Carboxylicivirga sediminis]|uniref:Curli production assembly/transport component CsgE n=1 Tax=Carboxylicivirga sediminis TaxID=2006564 RepID=A0A941F4R3_9BACT|nr:CsgE family curli-type amyloid fiber assembly protein [Carboxylicivirga sediminis]MBR8535675.1 hypothetical protein [Carboxylicivirga sediminis]